MNVSTDIFLQNIVNLIENAKKYVNKSIDIAMCITYYEIGRMIVEEEQQGKTRAKYGTGLLEQLSIFLTNRYGKGYSIQSLRSFRQFYMIYSQLIKDESCLQIQQTVFSESGKCNKPPIQQTLFSEFENDKLQIGQTLISQSEENYVTLYKNNQLYSENLYPFTVSWSHYLILMRIKNADERSFYEIETARNNWSVRHLQRQYNSSLYERLALSRDKCDIMRLANEGQIIQKPTDLMKNPLSLEFLGLEDQKSYRESDLESAIVSKLQMFLLELGKGFLFEARQKRFTFEEEHFYVDLVFYNRLLQCYVLIDIKTDKIKHQDLGQMQMYVNYFDEYIKEDFEKPTIGILLCREKNDSIVKLTLPKDANIYTSEYILYLPNKEVLQQKLSEWIREYNDSKGDKK